MMLQLSDFSPLSLCRSFLKVVRSVALAVLVATTMCPRERCSTTDTADPAAAPAQTSVPTAIRHTLSIQIPQSLEMSFVQVPSGTFKMGSPAFGWGGAVFRAFTVFVGHGSVSTDDRGPVRETIITRAFYLAQTKVTAAQYCEFLNEVPNPERFIVFNQWAVIKICNDGRFVPKEGRENIAVNSVPWEGAVAFCEWLSEKTGLNCRLPTEAEWEFAARGPENRRFPWGDSMDAHTFYGYTMDRDVGSAPANATPLGILDMVGPTAEWCSDRYLNRYDLNDRIDPQGPAEGKRRVLRGRGTEATDRLWQSEGVASVQGGLYGFRVLVEAND